MYNIRNLNIWKEDSRSLNLLTQNKIKELTVDGRVYPIYMGKKLMDAPIAEMNLSIRAENCLRRAGFQTIGDLVRQIDGFQDLKRFRNLGTISAQEIFRQLMDFQFQLLTEKEKPVYRKKVQELNEKCWEPVNLCIEEDGKVLYIDTCRRVKGGA